MVDASADHCGAALQQRTGPAATWQPLGFFSKKLDATQRRYSAYDRELLACVQGIRHFRFMLEGRPFTLYTDHKPLTFALSKAAEAWTARQSRHLSYVAEFTNDIRHISGENNVVADTLSRPPASQVNAVAATAAHLDYAAIAAAQRICPATRAAREASNTLLPVSYNGIELLSETSGPSPRPLIPAAHRRQVFNAFHSLGHPGVKATGRVIGTRVTWPYMKRDVAAWVRDCQACSRAKVTRQPAVAVQPIPVPSQRFSHIHVDFVGPLTTSKEGFRYLFTIIDRTSRWLEAIPMATMDTDACVEALISNWIARFGKPAVITSDRGSQFTSALWANTCHQLGVTHNATTAYHPQSNGMVERVHRHLKEGLKARGADADWPQHLPWVLLNIRTTPKSDSNTSAAEMVYGAALTLPAQPAAAEETPAAEADQQRQGRRIPTRLHQQPEQEVHLRDAAMVYVRRGGQPGPLASPYTGPYQVVERGPKFFRLTIGNQQQTVSVDRLKPHTGAAAATPAVPPRRGRPPAAPPAAAPPSPAASSPPTPAAARDASPGLPATANARPARRRRPPPRLDL
jgi:cleavage and polyadenylation specificity factor subunit 1